MKRNALVFGVSVMVLLVSVNGCKPSEEDSVNKASEDAVVSLEADKPLQKLSQVPADMILLDKLVQEYYVKQETAVVPKIMQLMDGLITAHGQELLKGMSAPALGFFSQIFKDNPKKLEAWQTTLFALSSRELKLVLLNALCFANSAEAQDILRKHTEDFPELKNIPLNQDVPNLLELPLEAPELLDLTWGAFYATGNLAFVKRILDIACMSEKDNEVNMTFRAALWSMVANASRHTQIHKFLNETLKAAPNETLRAFVKHLTMENRKIIFDDELLLKANILQVPPKGDEKAQK